MYNDYSISDLWENGYKYISKDGTIRYDISDETMRKIENIIDQTRELNLILVSRFWEISSADREIPKILIDLSRLLDKEFRYEIEGNRFRNIRRLPPLFDNRENKKAP